MIAAAHIAHATNRRVRLRVPSERRNIQFFARVEEALQKDPAVTKVSVDARTGSVLVHHHGEFAEIADHARAQDLFEVRTYDPPARTLETLRKTLLEANATLRRRTDGAFDLRTVGVMALLGGSAYQLVRGDFLPAGGTMLMQALDLVFGTARQDE